MACPYHNFSATRAPTGADDPCNNSGEGIFETGSYWLDTSGDCPRLYIRTGDTCGVAEWTEIPLVSTRFEAADPDVTDCCPAGTMWVNTATEAVYISYTDMDNDPPGDCKWCLICGPEDVVCVSADAVDFVVIDPATPPTTTILGLVPITVVVNNPNLTREMVVSINWTGSMLFVDSDGVGGPPELIGPDQIQLTPDFTVDGGAVFNPLARNTNYNVHMYGISYNRDSATQGWSGCATIDPGGTLTVAVTEALTVVNNTTISDIVVQGGSITVSEA